MSVCPYKEQKNNQKKMHNMRKGQSEKNAQMRKGLTPAILAHLTRIAGLKELLHNYSPKGGTLDFT